MFGGYHRRLLAAPVRADEQLGRISFPTSGSAEAQPHFIRGVLLLHSFEFDDAAEAFREARRIDPGFAMAYWGEALTHNHPLWRYQNRDAALKVLAGLGPTPEARRARAPTKREKAYLSAVDVLYGEGDKPARDRACAAALEAIARTYPDDDEARAFQSLALLGTNLEPRDHAVDMRAASAARVERKKLAASEHGYHAYLWLSYAYLQPGRIDDARRVVDQMRRLIAEAPAPSLTYHYAAARASWVIGSERWNDLPNATEAMAPVSPGGRAASLFCGWPCGHVAVTALQLSGVICPRQRRGRRRAGSAAAGRRQREQNAIRLWPAASSQAGARVARRGPACRGSAGRGCRCVPGGPEAGSGTTALRAWP